MGIFSGITVIDISEGISGRLCSMILSDLGAQVIHIDRPSDPGYMGEEYKGVPIRELNLMRGKKRVCLDIGSGGKEPDGGPAESKTSGNPRHLEILKGLAAQAQLFVEDGQPGVAERAGYGYGDLSAANPRLCYISVTDFGQTGPLSGMAASDLTLQALSGLMGITGEKDGPPIRAGIPVTGQYTGLYAAVGAIAMLIHQKKTGEGQYLDLAAADCMFTILENAAVNYMAVGKVQERIGNRHSVNVPFQEFHTRDDKDILITVNRDNTYAALCRVLGCEELISDPRYATSELRRQNRDACTQEVIDRVLLRDVDELENALVAAGIPCATINTIDKVVDSVNTSARGMIIEGENTLAGNFRMPAPPFKFNSIQVQAGTRVSLRGQDSEEVLSAFGYSV